MKTGYGVPLSALSTAIDEYVPHERNRNILKRKLIDDITFEKIAEEYELSVRQVKYIVYDYKEFIIQMAKR